MVDQYGGTPFSHFLGGSKKEKVDIELVKDQKDKLQKKPSRKKIHTNKRLKGKKNKMQNM